MKKFLLVSALICAIAGVAAQVAMAGPRLLVTGAGASPVAAQVVLHAEATGPATGFFPVFPAAGFLDARGLSPYFGVSGNLRGRVTCIGAPPGWHAVAVSGPNFTVLLRPSTQAGRGTIQVWGPGPFFDDCGANLFFSAGQELPETVAASTVVQGHFTIMGSAWPT